MKKFLNFFHSVAKLPVSKYRVVGESMLPSLIPGEQIVTFNWAYLVFRPEIGDVVVVNIKGRYLVKRIVQVKGQKLFLEGDNKEKSTDSRKYGWLDQASIIGKVVYKLN